MSKLAPETVVAFIGEIFNRRGAESYLGDPPSDAYLSGLLSKDSVIPIVAFIGQEIVGGLVAYELEKFEQQRSEVYIYDLAVDEKHRRQGIATALMRRSQKEMQDVFGAEYVSLHVRKSNRAAFHLYSVTLNYTVNDIEKGYYADGEDAYDMRCYFNQEKEKDKEPPTEELKKLELAA